MSYAVRNDGAGWRAVDGPDDCAPDETWSATQPEVTAPMPDVVDQPPQLTQQQIAKLADFFKTNPAIAQAMGL